MVFFLIVLKTLKFNFFSGDLHSILLLDMFGFECFPRNHIEQLLVNSLNEQLQYQYNQKMFAWEMLEQVSILNESLSYISLPKHKFSGRRNDSSGKFEIL